MNPISMLLVVLGFVFIPLICGLFGLKIIYILALYCLFAILVDVRFLLKSKGGIIDLSYENLEFHGKKYERIEQLLTKREYPFLFNLCYCSGIVILVILCVGLGTSVLLNNIVYELISLAISGIISLVISIMLSNKFYIPSL
jgi:hypothetical protein